MIRSALLPRSAALVTNPALSEWPAKSEGWSPAQALRQVQLEFLADPALRHPFYWASFIPIGTWGPVEFTEGKSQGGPEAGTPH